MNQVAVITGGKRGIGKALVKKFLDESYNVASCSKNEKNSEKNNVLVRVCYVSKIKYIKKFYDKVIKKFGRVDILVNNAGVAFYKKLDSTNLKEIDDTIDVNLRGVIYCTKIFLEQLKQSKGTLINISSGAGLSPFSNFSVYCASKYGVVGFSESLREELKDIRVYCVCPGPVDTGMYYKLFKEHPPTKPGDVAQKIFACIKGKYMPGVVES